MDEKFLQVLSFLDKLEQCTLEAYEEIKFTLLVVTKSSNPDLFNLIQEMCKLVEDSRPRLLEIHN